MKNKKLILLIFGLMAVLGLTYLFGVVWKPNVIRYAKVSVEDGVDLAFYGSFGEVRKVKLTVDGEQLGKFDFVADSKFLKTEPFDPQIVKMENGYTAIVIPCGLDADDGDLHAFAYFITQDKQVLANPDYDFANARQDTNGDWIAEQRYRTETAPSEEHDPPYRQVTVQTRYGIVDGGLRALEELSVTYYSETNIYCVTKRQWSGEAQTLNEGTDQWLVPAKYAAQREALQQKFSLPIPAENQLEIN